jgi:hypothetical protein
LENLKQKRADVIIQSEEIEKKKNDENYEMRAEEFAEGKPGTKYIKGQGNAEEIKNIQKEIVMKNVWDTYRNNQ